MKGGTILAGLVMAAAGGISAVALSFASSEGVSQQTARSAVVTAAPARAGTTSVAPAVAPPSPVAAAPVVTSALEVHQAPVPLLMKARPAVDLAAVATDEQTETDGFDENAAKAFIEADGYRGVRVLEKASGDVWRAQALRGGTVVMLTVDANGTVSTQ